MIEVVFFDEHPPLAIYSSFLSPPAQFDHDHPNMEIEFLSSDDIAGQCGNNGKAQACVLMRPYFEGDKCFVLLPRVGPGGVSQKTQDLLRRHERAHCSGWEHGS